MQYEILGYSASKFRYGLNLLRASRSSFARRWGLTPNTVRTWIARDNQGTAKKSFTIKEYGNRMLQADLELKVERIENYIMRDILMYKRGPSRKRLAELFGIPTPLVNQAIENLKRKEVLSRVEPTGHPKPHDNLGFFKVETIFEGHEIDPNFQQRPLKLRDDEGTKI